MNLRKIYALFYRVFFFISLGMLPAVFYYKQSWKRTQSNTKHPVVWKAFVYSWIDIDCLKKHYNISKQADYERLVLGYRVIFPSGTEQNWNSRGSTSISRAETSATCSLGLTICFHQFLAREIKNSVLGVNFNFGAPFSENHTSGPKWGFSSW